jgi:hypothetical protein
MKIILQVGFLLFALALALPLCAQEITDTTRLWRVETVDGNEYVGTIVRRDAQELQLRTENLGVITIRLRDARRLEALGEGRQPEEGLWRENLLATRYFWVSNGYGLRRGEGHYQNVWVLFNQATIGITDNLSFGAGLVPVFLFAGEATPVWITPKVSFPVVRDRVNLGAGALIATLIGGGEGTGFAGIAYGVATFGSRDRNLTAGLGYGFADGDWARIPAVNLSGMLRYGRSGYLMTENYLFDDGEEVLVLSLLGGRQVWRDVSLDYGLLIPFTEGEEFLAIPWLGLAVPFGRR